ncbi:MAG: hypothetical protein HON08_04220 [Gemmatimonadales bacterium]|nr:hypothetical protein [Gemmatimonadales bacterium]
MTHHVDDILGRLHGPQERRTQHLFDELDRESHDRESLTPPDAATLYPNPNDKGWPGTFLGVMETTRRVALQGRYQPQRLFFVEWDVGRSFVSNAGNVEGTSENRLSSLVRLGITLGAQGRLR